MSHGLTKAKPTDLGTGTPDSSTYLRGDGTWTGVAGTGAIPVGGYVLATTGDDPAVLLGYGTWTSVGRIAVTTP